MNKLKRIGKFAWKLFTKKEIKVKAEIAWTGHDEGEEPVITTAPEGLRETRSLEHAHPVLREKIRAMQQEAKRRYGKEIIITCVFRNDDRQAELYAVGRRGIEGERKVTYKDGDKLKSDHNFYPSRAVDVAIDEDPGVGQKITWKEKEYEFLGPLAKRHGLEWGGNWRKFKDRPHLQLPDSVV